MKIKGGWLFTILLTACLQSSFAAETDLARLAAANNTFAFKLLKQVAAGEKGGNIFISPYSLATTLQMVANGAAGQTKKEMEQVLETSGLATATVNAASKEVAGLLESTDTNLILTTANALWYRQGAEVKPGFIVANQNFFSSTVKALDFRNAPAAVAEINRWASDQTHGRINGIANGMISPLFTDLVLANAIYFKGRWEDPFDKNLTKERPFHPAAGAAKNLPMMAMSKKFIYRMGSDYQAVRLPYMGGALAMYVFLPDPGSSPAALLQMMNGDKWRRMTMPGIAERPGRVVLPKFKFDGMFDLIDVLQAMGMKTAFDNVRADFSGMFSDPHFISHVRQKTFVDVNEEGAEAAAATILSADSRAIAVKPETPFEMIMDRPFMFAIVDARSEMILFMGLINDLQT